MLPFESRNANIICVLSAFTLILWSGPARFLPGYVDRLPLAQTRHGLARGESWMSRDGRYFNAFRGIPYAKAPTGNLRFKLPEELDEDDAWEGAVDFNREAVRCHQNGLIGMMGREDCLQLNVYTPTLDPESSLPVMVFIHGGGFVLGSSDSIMYGPSFFMDKEIVLVTLNYRLGVLGFLSMENDEAPGNLGLWDQRMALVWVKKNIKYFGGDPNLVTIFGESAGSMSVNYHLLSPQSRGLFHRAIMQSGTALSPYVRLNRPASSYARDIAKMVGCDTSENMVKCLQSVPVEELTKHLMHFDECALRTDLGLTMPGPWVPIVDKFSDTPFLPESPDVMLIKNHVHQVPVMLGFNKDEGLMLTGRFQTDTGFSDKFRNDWRVCGPLNILGKEGANVTSSDIALVNSLVEKYTGKSFDNIADLDQLRDLFTDSLFGLNTHVASQLFVGNGNNDVFKYFFNHPGFTSICDIMMMPAWKITLYTLARLLRIPGLSPYSDKIACHADELFYLFKVTPILEMLLTEEEREVSRSMVGMWTEFARSGQPLPGAWVPAHEAQDDEYFVIGSDMKMMSIPEVQRFKHWEQTK